MYLALEIGGTKLQLALGDERASILEKRKLGVARGENAADIRRQIELALPDFPR